MGCNKKTGAIVVVGVLCLAIGTPILVIGIIMFTKGLSGMTYYVPMCCTAVTTNFDGVSYCTDYVSSGSNCSLPATAGTPSAVSTTLTQEHIRTDASYLVVVECPVSGSATATVKLEDPAGTTREWDSTLNVGAGLAGLPYCEAEDELDSDDLSSGYPVFSSQVLTEEFNLESLELGDEYTLKLTVSMTATDDVGRFAASATGAPLHGPRVKVTSDGFSSASSWGLALIIIGGIIICPPVTAIIGLLGGGN